MPAVLRLMTLLVLLPFTGCLFEDVKNTDTCVENYSQIHFQQIISNGVTSRNKSTGDDKQNGGVVCYSSYLDVFQNQRQS